MSRKVKVWDIATRTFHWSLVACFFIAYLSGDEENLLHIYSSYIIIALLAFRLVWGIIGPRYVRFTNFIYGIKTSLVYLRSVLIGHPKYYLGHNPLGSWMILLLLLSLIMTSWTGLELYAQEEGKGPLAGDKHSLIKSAHANGKKRDHDDDDERYDRENERGNEEWLEELHEALAEFTLLLVFIHISGVFVSSWLHKENLVRAMWTGYKTPPEDFKED